MVRLACALALLTTLATGLVSTLSARDWPDYQIGDTAKADVVTPIQLVVIDPDETAALKEREALKVPVLCRYNTNTVEEVENDFRFGLCHRPEQLPGAAGDRFSAQKSG